MIRIISFLTKKQEIADNSGLSAPCRQCGGVIIWILIMVALFGALSYTISNSTRTGGAKLTESQINLAASEILDYARSIKQAVQTLQINGCADTEISFENSVIGGYSTTNPSAPTDESCHIFRPNGGGLRFLKVPPNIMDPDYSTATHPTYGNYHFNAHHCVVGLGTDTPGCAAENIDLIMNITFLKKDVCMAINKLLGLEELNDFATKEGVSPATPYFNGVYGPGATVPLGDQEIRLENQSAACLQDDAGFSANAYIFYQALLAR